MRISFVSLVCVTGLIVGAAACGDDDNTSGSGGTSGGGGTSAKGGSAGTSTGGVGGTTAGSTSKGGSTSGGKSGAAGGGAGGEAGAGLAGAAGAAGATSLCEKYGGSTAVDGVVRTNIIGNHLANDCHINNFFLTLPAGGLAHVADCLSIQVQGLFNCPGVVYAGSTDSKGAACRTMAVAHQGLGISSGDFTALIDDVVSGMTEAGIESSDINSVAPTLLGLKGDIVEAPTNNGYTQSMCGAGGAGGAGGAAGSGGQ